MSEQSTATNTTYVVKSAIYGATSSTYQSSAADVSALLQGHLDNGHVQLCISNGMPSPNPGVGPYPPFPDPAVGDGKGFGAIVAVNGVDQFFACGEGGTIDFSVQPQDAAPVLQLSNLQITYAPTKQYVFGPCSFVLTNGSSPFTAGPPPYVSIDFYLTTSNTAAPTAANKIGDMPCQISPSPLPANAQMTVSGASQLFNISRLLEQNPSIGPAAGTTCYVFATMRRPDGTIHKADGAYSAAFTYEGVTPAATVGA
jgi:hypothetical protein